MAYAIRLNGIHNNSNGTPRVSEFKIKEQMCDIGRRIWLKGFCAGNEGNHSYRIGENRILCTPTGISKGNLKPDDICTVDGEGKQIAGKRKRTSEILMHAAIYKARPDVKAVIHSHPPHATAFAIAGVELPTCIHPEAEVFLGPVKTAKYVTPGDKRLGESILPLRQGSQHDPAWATTAWSASTPIWRVLLQARNRRRLRPHPAARQAARQRQPARAATR